MSRADEYRSKAEEAEERADRATTPAERDAYRKIAQGWRDLERDSGWAVRRGR